jgi:hypothetical protein
MSCGSTAIAGSSGSTAPCRPGGFARAGRRRRLSRRLASVDVDTDGLPRHVGFVRAFTADDADAVDELSVSSLLGNRERSRPAVQYLPQAGRRRR